MLFINPSRHTYRPLSVRESFISALVCPHEKSFAAWLDEIEVMKSLARPKKLALRGSDGQIYMFLGKPKDDLRKDARLMDFNMIINKLLKANTESRRRQLCALSLLFSETHPADCLSQTSGPTVLSL